MELPIGSRRPGALSHGPPDILAPIPDGSGARVRHLMMDAMAEPSSRCWLVPHAPLPMTPTAYPNDEAFQATLERARSGDSRALEELVERFYARVESGVHFRLSRDLRLGCPWLASRFSTGDIVHEVFHSVIRDLSAFGGHTEDAFAGYLAMVIRNRIIDSIRFHEAACRDGRRALSLEDDSDPREEDSGVDPAVIAARMDALEQLEEAMRSFGERERLGVRARFEGSASFQELADQLGYGSESSARRAFFDAQAKLALKLKPHGNSENPLS